MSDLLAASEPAPPETASIASAHQLQLQSRLKNSSAASLLCQPATVEHFHKEDHHVAARKKAKSCQVASRYNEHSVRYPAGAPGFKLTALFRASHSPVCYEDDMISSPLLLAPANPLQEQFLSVCIGHAQLPWSLVILTVNICYSGCLRISTSHSLMNTMN
jgi:hypothetical protein